MTLRFSRHLSHPGDPQVHVLAFVSGEREWLSIEVIETLGNDGQPVECNDRELLEIMECAVKAADCAGDRETLRYASEGAD